jgi:L-2-hydroxyglutarate oxidase
LRATTIRQPYEGVVVNVRYAVIGGGIVGLATARALAAADPAATVTVLEKESDWGQHQTGHNSGVVHSGVSYKPGSLKAALCTAGAESMVAFAKERGLPVDVCGKLIVATEPDELPRLEQLYERGVANGVPVRRITPSEARELEPAIACLMAVHVASTAVIDYAAVTRALADELKAAGADLQLDAEVVDLATDGQTVRVGIADRPELAVDVVVNCAGLNSDRVASLLGGTPPVRIIPFRGEYYVLRPEAAALVRGLIYPVADPRLPFLGVHLTRGIDQVVHVGPNAVLALSREGYGRRDFALRDTIDVLRYPGFWHLARTYGGTGFDEVRRSFSRRRFAASAARLVPDLTADDIVPAGSGIRAQAVRPNGELVDDFLIVRRGRVLNVLNAPSPAATSALEIGQRVAASARELAGAST